MRWGEVSQSVVTSIAYIVLGVGFIVALYVLKYLNDKKTVVLTNVESAEIKEELINEVVVKNKELSEPKTKKTNKKASSKKEDK